MGNGTETKYREETVFGTKNKHSSARVTNHKQTLTLPRSSRRLRHGLDRSPTGHRTTSRMRGRGLTTEKNNGLRQTTERTPGSPRGPPLLGQRTKKKCAAPCELPANRTSDDD